MGILVQIAEPSPPYKPYIIYYKYIESDITGILKAIPIKDVELYFNFTHINVFCRGYYDVDNPRIHLVGLQHLDQNGYTHMYGTDRNGGFVVVFKPQGFYQLFGIKISDFTKYALDGNYLFKDEIYLLHEQLQSFYNVNDMKILFENYISKYLKQSVHQSCLINEIISYMGKSAGMIRVTQICKIFNIGTRSLQRLFKDEIGLSTIELLQILRINKAIRLLNSEKDFDLSEISYLCGYYDQSHFIKDIRKITGTTPGQINNNKSISKSIHHNRVFIIGK